MPSHPARASAKQALTQFDLRIEAAIGHSIDQLWQHRGRNLLDEPRTCLADAHRALVQAEQAVTFYRVQLRRLASDEFAVDQALFTRINRTVAALKEAAATRDQRETQVKAALESVEAATRTRGAGGGPELPAPDQAALLAIAQGAKLREHLLTQRLSVVTASGVRIAYSHLQRFEAAGLVVRDEAHPLHAGQPVTLTDAGRALLASRRVPAPPAAPPVQRAGAWPASSAPRR
ncbi:hypothetical protein [Streptomyces stelliscabiei]|uniref:Uncharacterized protein n=1 Tax=Streptomyces stelliscabiei TaxID=146820 RepID=A0A8I0PC41_9ACTN|nr:hypothetical protein [Streptomyces stelliscabiei]KND28457.1 hypothetical protein IQ64_43645 [Streptomyces stelliscabiei]MBE1599911.1 hypothetical protein [Streptomyces stelliscabiei]